eukprot:Nitzschia sp. Nitz4//scaffold46_size129759//10381//12033//NITZ4_003480-RA/size129759-snap-gene-0.1-mRNA-1//1//CDS//3329552532//6252//frame0
MMKLNVCFVWIWVLVVHRFHGLEAASSQADDVQTCAWDDEQCRDAATKDPNLVPIEVGFDDGSVTEEVYITPDVATFYNETPGSMKPKETSFRGQFAKFINMSPDPIRIFWKGPKGERYYIADIAPFGAAGTATHPSHHFEATPNDDDSKILANFRIVRTNSLYKYDPLGSLAEATKSLSPSQLELYKLQHRSLAYSKVYERKTGRQWIALYGRKHKPRFPMWAADYFNQSHTVVTKETHFLEQPPSKLTEQRVSMSSPTERDRKLREDLQPYRDPSDTLTLNLTVLSVSPRVFEIQNFLSNEEVLHILEIATGAKLARSTTQAGNVAQATTNDATRTSRNSWIARNRSPIVDAIYRRAADLTQIDEACFRNRVTPEEIQLVPNSTVSVAERLQLVHYDVGQQYTPHHDFATPGLEDGQPSRFATLLLYLNEGMDGGETSFPRWLNGKTNQVLSVAPEVGKAVLFYSVLPDGNYDERSQHAALPVRKGEKWLTNLWIWDPRIG